MHRVLKKDEPVVSWFAWIYRGGLHQASAVGSTRGGDPSSCLSSPGRIHAPEKGPTKYIRYENDDGQYALDTGSDNLSSSSASLKIA